MDITYRKAERRDLFSIHRLVSSASIDDDSLLNRSLADIGAHLDTFFVGEVNGEVIGCVAVHPYTRDICEVRSHVIAHVYRGKGYGGYLMDAAIRYAQERYPRVWMDAKKEEYFMNNWPFRIFPRHRMPPAILIQKIKWVFAQERQRWLPSLTGRFTLLELKGQG